ncbi:MAG: tRNA (adenosine(37)-N6)-threonylcarbamoyltransferase complex transferase subunit TsaD, partial [Clostridia bacterium]|nr:tRNA (adenosine(37)-N6)-threonylcarbamoyltransferase complex transferase subunit TsaD [Clostridia bacterium]
MRGNIVILAIESSCDETACAIMRGKELLSNVVATQIEIHRRFGGVVPEIASRNHTLAVENVVKEALEKAKMTLDDIDVIGVTYGAGLLGALLVGVSYAKSLAYATGKPLIAVNHIKGHIAANYIACPDLVPPYICLIASGGHTAICKVQDFNQVEIIGSTVDDACGEAFDKVARCLGLPYPGGVEIEKLAQEGSNTIELPLPFKGEEHFNFSYSGLKTAVINYIHNKEQKGEDYNKADIAHSFQSRAIGMLVDNTIRACLKYEYKSIVIAGGVGANKLLRQKMSEQGEKHSIQVIYPPLNLCTDNAAMIASETRILIESGVKCSNIDLDGSANVQI